MVELYPKTSVWFSCSGYLWCWTLQRISTNGIHIWMYHIYRHTKTLTQVLAHAPINGFTGIQYYSSGLVKNWKNTFHVLWDFITYKVRPKSVQSTLVWPTVNHGWWSNSLSRISALLGQWPIIIKVTNIYTMRTSHLRVLCCS